MEEPLTGQTPIVPIVTHFAAKQERASHEVDAIVSQLSANWISTLEHWQMLDVDAKKELGLPAVLVAHLDSLSNPSSVPSILPSLLAALPLSHAPTRNLSRFNYCYFLALRGRTYFWLGERSYEFAETDRVSALLSRLEGTATLRDATGNPMQTEAPLSSALASSGRVVVGENVYLMRPFGSWKAVDHWLCSIGLPQYRQVFEEEGVDDFLVLPFLRLSSLDDMHITSSDDKRTISLAVQALQDCLPGDLVGLWIRHLGYANYVEKFVKHQIWPQLLLVLKEEDLRLIGVKPSDVPVLWELIRSYQQFSSVEASYLWLRSHGFENYAFQFVRYNIPFYALPLVNFFIIGEMAVLGDNQELLRALQALKESPAYNVKAIAFWLRDLELSNYTQTFAKNLMVNFIESLTILTDHTINRLVPTVMPDRNKLKTAVREMKEFRFYYLATAALLEDPIMQKHAQLFAEHGVSIDVLPLLNDTHIQEMGVTDPGDRVKILEALKKLRELPAVDKNSRMMGGSGAKKFGSQAPGMSKESASLSLATSPTSLSALDMKMGGIGLSTSPSSLGLSALGSSPLDLRVPSDMKLSKSPAPKRKPAKK